MDSRSQALVVQLEQTKSDLEGLLTDKIRNSLAVILATTEIAESKLSREEAILIDNAVSQITTASKQCISLLEEIERVLYHIDRNRVSQEKSGVLSK